MNTKEFCISRSILALLYIYIELEYGIMHSTDRLRTMDQLFIFKI
jgi:hypothetical protein